MNRLKIQLKKGDTYEVCLTNEFTYKTECTSFELYKVLRRINPAPYSSYFNFPWGSILSSSPESFLSLGRERKVMTEPIKGTIGKACTPEGNLLQRQKLLKGEKENAELFMITDLLRNDLAKVCYPGTVKIESLKKISELASVFQLSSVIKGKLRKDRDSIDLIEACFPGGSITGAPKKRTMEIISQLEKRKRGVYTGSIGYIGYDGSLELNIAIRTLIKEGKTIRIGAGGAIVADSIPEEEYQEVLLKLNALLPYKKSLFL